MHDCKLHSLAIGNPAFCNRAVGRLEGGALQVNFSGSVLPVASCF